MHAEWTGHGICAGRCNEAELTAKRSLQISCSFQARASSDYPADCRADGSARPHLRALGDDEPVKSSRYVS